jgi:hypothetical protein
MDWDSLVPQAASTEGQGDRASMALVVFPLSSRLD